MVALLLSHLWWKLLSADNLVFTFICRGSQIEENCYLDTFLFVQSHFKILEYMILGQFYSTPPNIFLVGFRWDGHYGPEMGGMDPTCHWVVHISQKFVSTPQMFGTNIRIENVSNPLNV